MGAAASVQTIDAPEWVDLKTARALCLQAFGDSYQDLFSEQVFHGLASDGVVSREDFLKLVSTELNSSLVKEKPDEPVVATQVANPDPSNHVRRGLTEEEKSLAASTPLSKLVDGMDRLNGTGRVPCVLVAIGKYNPVNLMHLHVFEVAKRYLEKHTSFGIIGGYMCPMHDKLVKSACRGDVRQAIPGRRRLDMCQIAVAESKWVDVGRWEITQRTGHLDYPEILHRMSDLFKSFFRGHPNCNGGKEVHTMYLCGGDDLAKCTPDNLRQYGCVCVTRPGWIQKVADVFEEQWHGIVHVVEDTSVVDVALADLSSTKVRRYMKLRKEVGNLVGPRVVKYMRKHKVIEKMNTKCPEEWSDKDASMAKLRPNPIPDIEGCSWASPNSEAHVDEAVIPGNPSNADVESSGVGNHTT